MKQRIALRLFVAGLVVAAYVSVPQMVQAQGNSLFGGSGVTKSGTGGISGSLGGTGFGSTGSAGGRGATGSGGLGQGASPFGATGQNGAMSGTNPFGTTGANQGMVGRNSGAFAGNSQANQAGAGATGRNGGTRNFGNTGSNNQRGNNNNQNTKPERTTSMIRPRQRVAFDYNVKSPEILASRVMVRMEKISVKNPALKGVSVVLDGDQLVLTGKVKSEDQSRLAAILVRQEPGVRSVRNDLEIEQPTSVE